MKMRTQLLSLIKNLFERAFSSLFAVSISFFITGMLLLFSEKNQKNRNLSNKTAASILRQMYVHGMVGVNRLRVKYGGKKSELGRLIVRDPKTLMTTVGDIDGKDIITCFPTNKDYVNRKIRDNIWKKMN